MGRLILKALSEMHCVVTNSRWQIKNVEIVAVHIWKNIFL
uniref:Uncharacterized protein n=1 Tax=Anguilla anguilla TaxID=7936 RepID=A0A0E9XQX1_ANGAN